MESKSHLLEEENIMLNFVTRNRVVSRTFLLALLTFIFASCAAKKPMAETQSPYDKQYKDSVNLAKNPAPAKIYGNLVPITKENQELTWKTIDGVDYVLMVSYVTSFSYYEGSVGKLYNTGSYYSWVTAFPYLKNVCSNGQWQNGNLTLRLNQVLGLPPNDVKAGFVEMWVKPQNLFRPCPDNEITDKTCDLCLPGDVESWYREWFNDIRAKQYYFCGTNNGYPWTQLGYTFDWKDLQNPVGMSEFVVKANSDVVIQALIPTTDYCPAN